MHVVLVCPEIPPNTGNIIRLCANTGAELHLVEPLGFKLDEKPLRRAGLDYHEWARIQLHPNLQTALAATGAPKHRQFALTTRGQSHVHDHQFLAGDCFVFGRETRGLFDEERALFDQDRWLRLPMRPGQRSLNLSNAVAVTVFEAWRQLQFAGCASLPADSQDGTGGG